MADSIQFKRGLKDFLPVLDVAEPAFCTDTKEFYIGSSAGNIKVGGITHLIDESVEQNIVYELVNNTEVTFVEESPTAVSIVIPEQVFPGFFAGVNFNVGEIRPLISITNSSPYTLKKRIYDYTIEEDYIPDKVPCTVNLMFWCDGLYLYCQIVEIN